MISEVSTVAAITTICYLIGLLCKAVEFLDDKYIPVIMGVLGAILGIAGWLTTPDFPAVTWLSAVEVGIVSGLAATGINQVYKQLKEGGNGAEHNESNDQ